MNHEHYPAYKPAGVPWLTDVPEHWEVQRAKSLFRIIDVKSKTGKEELLTVSSVNGIVRRRESNVNMFKAKTYVGHKLCWPKDLVINSLWAWGRGLGFAREHGIISSAYGVYRLRSGHEHLWEYLDYTLRSSAYQWELQVRSKGVWKSRLQLSDASFLDMPILIPPKEDAELIVRYLRALDAKVKRYIRTKRKLIAALQEQKQAIIQRAVTQGLDPNVKLKPSGVEWLGEVPEHWEVRMVKRQYRIDLGKMLNASKGVEHSEYRYLNAANIHWDRIKLEKVNEMPFNAEQRIHYRLVKGDVLVTEGGATVGRTAIWSEELAECYYQNSINRARPTGHLPGRYLLHWMFYVTRSGLIEAAANAATFGHLTKEKLSRLPLLVPPGDEAATIVDHIDRECSALVEPERRLHEQIAMMNEYHTRLIADVVTGAVDVREAAGKLPVDQMIGRSDDQMMEEEPLSMAAEGEAEYGVEEV